MTKTTFSELKLLEPIQRSLSAANYSEPTPIQAEAIPHLLEGGDLLGCAQTGTGKTAAFAIPVLQRLELSNKRPQPGCARSLILTPTRELAIQIADSFKTYGKNLKLSSTVIYGGVNQNPQVRKLSKGVDVLIATPGRLLDLINQGHIELKQVEMLVLDEADRMLDMGFIKDVKKILTYIPQKRQTLLFSATMPKEVAHLAEGVLSNPKKIQINPVSSTAELIDDQVLFVEKSKKRALLVEILRESQVERAIIFTRTKHGANRLVRQLGEKKIKADAIHGNKSQNARQKALNAFSSGELPILVATDIVARGIDVAGVSHVINYELPNEPESYVHRIGRTARAGTSGIALSFCEAEEVAYLKDIEKILKRKIEINREHSFHDEKIEEISTRDYVPRPKRPQGRGRPSRGNSRGNSNGRRQSRNTKKKASSR